ncbi:hypothetical protein EYZ11_006916 [Aspergillus tanneri]|uniref:Uncharacterized protein n=1 Tax=Aspergillus tanneri TaxID=1220188 RepID=A0A4S3JJX7_9EURO|nr:hypothetical protein EYZ11_006916 [Aspergillus tanneri]
MSVDPFTGINYSDWNSQPNREQPKLWTGLYLHFAFLYHELEDDDLVEDGENTTIRGTEETTLSENVRF